MFSKRSLQHVLTAMVFSISTLYAADEAKEAEAGKKEQPVAYTWKDWNATPTPPEGRRIVDYYDFGEYYCTDTHEFHRVEFELGAEANDAWLVFYSYLDVAYARKIAFSHEIYVNSTLVHAYPKADEVYNRFDMVVVPASGLRKGKNVLWARTMWSSLKLIANGVDGSQTVVSLSPAWRSSNFRRPGWDLPDYRGPCEEIRCRLGTEGYHCNIIPYMGHPYAGLIDLRKDREAPIYKAGERLSWTVTIPTRFYGIENPGLECVVRRCFEDKKEVLTGKGRLLEAKDGRSAYELAFTVPAVGAYDVTIRFGDKPAMERKEELVSTGRVEQPVIKNAQNLIKGLDLTKVDELDCADIRDQAHDLVQGHLAGKEPVGKVVSNKGMTYFETGTIPAFLGGLENAEYAMWKLTAKDLNEWHLAEVDIPDDKDRVQIVALVHNIATREYGVESTIEMGNPRPSTNRMYTHRMLFIPKFHDVRVMIAPAPTTRETRNPAAVKAIRLYRVNGRLPAVKLGDSGRRSSTYNERSNLVAISFYPGSEGINRFSGPQTFAPGQYRRWFLAVQRHVEYLRFCGHNAVCQGMYQYTKEEYPAGKGQTDYISIMLDMYHANDIDFYGNIEYCTSNRLEGKTDLGHVVGAMKVTDAEVAAGKDTCRMVSREGKQVTSYPFNNPCHPDLKQDLLRIVGDIGRRYGAHPGFKGLMFFAGTMGCALTFGGPERGFEDCTYSLFRSSSRKDAPDFKGPQRFSDRNQWISQNSSADWEKFRCEQVYLLFKSIITTLKQYAPQSRLLVNACAWPWQNNIGGGSVEELDQRLLGTGTDVNLFLNDPDMLVMHNEWDGGHVTEKELSFVERYNADGKIWQYVTRGKPCAVFFWTGFYETALFFPREMSNPSWYDEAVLIKSGVNLEKRFIGSAGRAGRNYLSPYATAFANADPVFFANRFTDVAEHRGFLEQRAEAGQAISFIPIGTYTAQPGSTESCALRRSGNNAYVVNHSSQAAHATITVTSSGSSQATVKDRVADKAIGLARRNGMTASNSADYSFAVELMPYQVLPLSLDGAGEIKIQSK